MTKKEKSLQEKYLNRKTNRHLVRQKKTASQTEKQKLIQQDGGLVTEIDSWQIGGHAH